MPCEWQIFNAGFAVQISANVFFTVRQSGILQFKSGLYCKMRGRQLHFQRNTPSLGGTCTAISGIETNPLRPPKQTDSVYFVRHLFWGVEPQNTMNLTSTAFKPGSNIPSRYSQYGENLIPPLLVEDIPPDTKSLALVMDDPDTAKGTFTHWLVYDWNPNHLDIAENEIPQGATQGCNDMGTRDYRGPKPPSGEHRYFFKIYALDVEQLVLSQGSNRDDIETALQGRILGQATLMGRFAYEPREI